MMRKCFLSLIIFCCIIQQINGQAIQFQVPDYFWNRTKSISQFMDRFSRRDIPPMFDSTDINLPYLQVISCFFLDSVYTRKDEVMAFAKKMVDSNIVLDLHKPNYCCELECKATFKGRPTMIILALVMEQTVDSGYCWTIAQAKGKVLRLRPNRTTPTMHISPVDNDMEFVGLLEAIQSQPRDLRNYMYSQWSADETSAFLAFVSTGQMKIERIEDMRYVFYTGGYEFKVKQINRETNNNGWLIYDFTKYEED